MREYYINLKLMTCVWVSECRHIHTHNENCHRLEMSSFYLYFSQSDIYSQHNIPEIRSAKERLPLSLMMVELKKLVSEAKV